MTTYVFALLALVGSVLNARKKRIGFIFWIITNLYWVIHNIICAEYAQAFIYMANTVISIFGLINWKKIKRKEKNSMKMKDKVKELFKKYGEFVFRAGLYYMTAKGSEHFTDENVDEIYKAIDGEDITIKGAGKKPIVSPDYQKAIVACAAELSKIKIAVILWYVKENLSFDDPESWGQEE